LIQELNSNNILNTQLILASNSPRRKQILEEAGISFKIRTKDVPEIYPESLDCRKVPSYLAVLKAKAFSDLNDQTIITADTIVLLDGKILGKPSGRDDALAMLRSLSGKKHEVITGVCILNKNTQVIFSDTTDVYFKNLSEEQINYYLDHFKPYDKAGAYGIQEWIGMVGVEKISGSYFNVMGLPIHKVYTELKKLALI
jgi:septum formation protein